MILTFFVVAFLAALVTMILIKKGKIKDSDGDLIPDAVEDTVKEVKHRAKRVKEELNDVKEAAKDVVEQVGDVAEAVKGKPRKGRKSSK